MKNNIPGYPGYYLSRKGNLWRFKKGEWVKVKRYISPKGIHMFTYIILKLKGQILKD